MKNLWNWFKDEESGQGMVEYALIIAVIAAIVIVVMGILGPKIVTLGKTDKLNAPTVNTSDGTLS